MKSRKYMIAHALLVAKDYKANVGVVFAVFGNARDAFVDATPLAVELGFAKDRQDLSFTHPSGGKVKVRYMDEENMNTHAGSQYSHLYVVDELDPVLERFMQSRIRDTREFVGAPMGTYKPYGAQVWIDY